MSEVPAETSQPGQQSTQQTGADKAVDDGKNKKSDTLKLRLDLNLYGSSSLISQYCNFIGHIVDQRSLSCRDVDIQLKAKASPLCI